MTNFHSSPTFLRFFTSWVVVLPLLGLLSLDSFGSQNTVGKLIGVPSYQLVLPALLCLFLIRLKFGTVLDKLTTWMVAFISVMGFLIATVLSALEMVSPPNTVYSLTRLHQSQVLLVAITGGLIFFLNKKNSWWKSHWQKTLFWLPFVFFYVALVTRSFPFDVFHELVKEDKLVENMQFWVLIGGSITSFLTAFRLKSRAAVLPAMVYLFLGLAFLFVAGDEIAWGQRILRIEVSESIKQVNRQDELTVHNLYAFEWLVLYGYLGISAIGLFSRFIFQRITRFKSLVTFTPGYILIGYFVVPFIYYFKQLIEPNGIWHAWTEVAELYFYTGLVLWAVLFARKLLAHSSDMA